VAVAAGVVLDAEGAEASSAERMLAEALEANRQLSELADGLIEDNARLRGQVARLAARDAELERLRADFAVLQRLLFGRSPERSRPEPPAAGDPAGGGDCAGRDRERFGVQIITRQGCALSWRVVGRTRQKDVGCLGLNWLRRSGGNVYLPALGRGGSARFQGRGRAQDISAKVGIGP
jgi:hypothetical protein